MAASVENPFAGQGAVLLDIGGDVGALVVTMPAELEGFEVEIQPAGTGDKPVLQSPGHPADHAHDHDDHGHDHGHDHDGGHAHHPHVAVVNRPVGEGTIASLVFPAVVAGDYELVPKDGGPVQLRVHVDGGMVTSADWLSGGTPD